MGWGGRWERGSGWGTHVNPWLIHVNAWQKPLQLISFRLKKKIHLPCGTRGFDPWVGKIFWRRALQPTPVVLSAESPLTEEPGGLQSMGSQRVRHD